MNEDEKEIVKFINAVIFILDSLLFCFFVFIVGGVLNGFVG